jgi:hypothetical protein
MTVVRTGFVCDETASDMGDAFSDMGDALFPTGQIVTGYVVLEALEIQLL